MKFPTLLLGLILSCYHVNSFAADATTANAKLEIIQAAHGFLTTLDEQQRAEAQFRFNHEERENWHYVPRERRGIPLKAMTEVQKMAAGNLLRSTMSDEGLQKAEDLIRMEGILSELEGQPNQRDIGNYFFSLFGTPGETGSWGWRLEGHHLSLNITFIQGQYAAATPSFMGANPAELKQGPNKGFRPLASEEDLARALAVMFVEAGRTEVRFDQKAPNEIISFADKKAKPLEAAGVSAASMSPAQREALMILIKQYTGRHRSELAIVDLKKIEAAGIENISFGWAGSLQRGKAFYYRVQGPTFLMEAANVRNGANHIHTVWRDFNGDFGRDLLAEHLQDDSHQSD